MEDYRTASYNISGVVREAKYRYREKLELQQSNPRGLWQGLKMVTDYAAPISKVEVDSSLADKLNRFYVCFETSGSQ